MDLAAAQAAEGSPMLTSLANVGPEIMAIRSLKPFGKTELEYARRGKVRFLLYAF